MFVCVYYLYCDKNCTNDKLFSYHYIYMLYFNNLSHGKHKFSFDLPILLSSRYVDSPVQGCTGSWAGLDC